MKNVRCGVLDSRIELGNLGGDIFGGLLFIYSRSFRVVSPIRRAKGKIGKNQLCTCGSNKKYKNCCGGKEK